jgi:RHS repeat-associated protein
MVTHTSHTSGGHAPHPSGGSAGEHTAPHTEHSPSRPPSEHEGGRSPHPNEDGTPGGGSGQKLGLTPSSLDNAASKLDHTSQQLHGVAQGIGGINVGPQSFGLIGQGFAGNTSQHLHKTQNLTAHAADNVGHAATATKHTAEDYRNTEEHNSQVFGSINPEGRPAPHPSGGTSTAPSSAHEPSAPPVHQPPTTHHDGEGSGGGEHHTDAPSGHPVNRPPTTGTHASSSGEESIRNNNTHPHENDTPTSNRPAAADPIDMSTGRVMLTQDDVELAGVLPLLLSRTHLSSYRLGRWFGPSWASTVDQRLEVDEQGVCFAAADGTLLAYPDPVVGQSVLPESGPRWPMTRAEDGSYVISNPGADQMWVFAPNGGQRMPITAIGDGNGHRIHFDYDATGTLTGIRHSAGYHVAVATADGLITGLRLVGEDGDIEVVSYRYDQDRRLVEVVNSSGLPLRFDYDPAGRIVRWEDRNGMSYRYAFDGDGRCVRASGAGGYLDYTFAYDPESRVTRATNSLGHTTAYHFNDALQLVRVVDPLGHATVSEWDRHDHLLSRTDPLGRTTRYDYDADGNLSTVTRPDGSQELTEYDDAGRPVTVVDPDGAVWRYEYATDRSATVAIDPAGARTTYGYDDAGHLAAITDALGHTTRIQSNAAGLPTTVTDPLGATTTYQYDPFGRLAAVTDPLGGTTRWVWTVEGKPRECVRPDGSAHRWTWDGEGNVREVVDPQGQSIRTEIAHFDLPVTETGPDGASLKFDYDPELRLVGVTNAQGLVWRYDYDPAGNLVRETDFNGRVVNYQRDAAGQLVALTNAVGQTVRLTRDQLGRVVRKVAGEAVSTFDYDPVGRLVRARNGDAELRFGYDAVGRLLAETVNGRTVASGYDVLGRRVRRRTPTGSESVWEYDPNDQPTALHTAGHTVRFDYDAAGQEVERRAGAVTLAQAWDSRHRLLSQTLLAGAGESASPARMVQRREYTYQRDGVLTALQDRLSGPRRFELDPVGRVTAVHGAHWSERYAYDPAGNITHATRPGEASVPADPALGTREYAGVLITRAGHTRYHHDAQGRMLTRERPSSSARPESWHYTWDAEDRLVGVLTPDNQLWRYRYDPLGRRIAKQRVDSSGGVLDQVIFTWDGDDLVEQVAGGGSAVVWDWAPAGDRVVSQTERVPRPDAPQQWIDHRFYAIVTDLVGTPTELVAPDGTLAWHLRTTLWGTLLSPPGTAYTPLRFPGQYHDPETGLHYNRHRYYDPATGRYASSDPLGLDAAPNPMAYVVNPTGWTDPLGLSPCPNLTSDQLHSNPPGPSLRLRGPRKSHQPGRTPNKVRNPDHWDTITNRANEPHIHKERLSFNDHPQTLTETRPGLPGAIRNAALDMPHANGHVTPVMSNNHAVEAIGRLDPHTRPYWEAQDARRVQLAHNTSNLGQHPPAIDPHMVHDTDTRLNNAHDELHGAQDLLAHHDGLVIGVGHGNPAGWNFMSQNMQQLHAQGVNTIYVESLRSDAHQHLVDEYMHSPAGTPMPPQLQSYLNHAGQPGLTATITAAKDNGVRIVGIDGMPAKSGGVLGLEGSHIRASMMNSYASDIITHDHAANPGKYLVEAGRAHTTQHTGPAGGITIHDQHIPQHFPGMGQILGVPAIETDGSRFSQIHP